MPPKQSREKSQDPTRDKCARCKRVKHIDDVEEQGEPKQSMSKKKSHKNKTVNDKICCHHCKAWYHYRCSGLEQWQYEIYEKWHCEKCAETAGPSVEHKKVAINRYHWWSLDEAKNENVEVGSEAWINSHKTSEHKIQAASDKEVIVVKNGTEFYKKLDETKHEWKKVVLIQNKAGLGIKVPEKDTFDVEKIVEIMGPNHEVDTIAVYRQRPYAMKLESFLKLYRAPIPRKELYNFLSCEFSEFEEMRSILTPPRFVLEQSFVDLLYPRHGSKEYKALVKNGEALPEDERPKVEEYLLAGMAGSYTDFHIDFGGSSVYYHVIYGKKVFYLVEPTEENLKAFEKHETNSKTHDWFGTKCQSSLRRLVVTEGQTLIMPAGWIHAVYTPEDSLVFGGNFLHLACVPMQMRIYRLENAMKAVVNGDDKYYFPDFELLHWRCLRNLFIEKLREFNDEGKKSDPVLLRAAKSCLNTMKAWFKKDQRKIGKRGASSAEEEDSLKSDLENKEILLKELEKQIKKQNTIWNKAGGSAPTNRKMAANAKKRTTSTSNKRDASRGRNAPKRKKGQNEDEEDEENEEIEEEEAPQEPRIEEEIVAPHNNQNEVVDEDDVRPVAPVSPLHAPVASGTMTGQGPSGVNNHLQSTGLTQVANPTTTSGNTVGGKRGRQVAAPINTDAPSTSSQSIVNGRGQEHEVLEDVEIKPNIENLSAVSQAEKDRRLEEFDGTMNWKWNTHQLCEKVEEIGRLKDVTAPHIRQMVRFLHEQKFTGHVLKLSSEAEIKALYVELKMDYGTRMMLTSILKTLGWPAIPTN